MTNNDLVCDIAQLLKLYLICNQNKSADLIHPSLEAVAKKLKQIVFHYFIFQHV